MNIDFQGLQTLPHLKDTQSNLLSLHFESDMKIVVLPDWIFPKYQWEENEEWTVPCQDQCQHGSSEKHCLYSLSRIKDYWTKKQQINKNQMKDEREEWWIPKNRGPKTKANKNIIIEFLFIYFNINQVNQDMSHTALTCYLLVNKVSY